MKRTVSLLKNGILTLIFTLSLLFSFAQTTFPVTGKITDAAGKPLESVTVQVKGSGATTVTKADGSFSITAPSGNAVLTISSVGFTSQDFNVNNRAEMTMSLAAANDIMQDVVVVGYGTRRRGDVTGSVASINSEKLRSVPTANLTQALQGRVAGLEVAPSSFRPGSGARIRIRGNRSLGGTLGASNEPLYVVDGIPVSHTIDDMNPLDIESVDVLKDASATAIYGARGANGVIQITTKKGRSGKMTVDYQGSVSFENILKHIPVFNALELTDMWRQAFSADGAYNFAQNTSQKNNYFPNAAADAKLFGGSSGNAMWEFVKDAYQFRVFDRPSNTYIAAKRAATTEEKGLLSRLGFDVLDSLDIYDPSKVRGYNWQDAAIRQGLTNSHSITLTAGTEKIRSSFSGSYFKQKGIEFGQDYTRVTAGNNTEFKPTKFLTVGNSITYSNGTQNVGPSTYGAASGQLPISQPYDSAGNFDFYPNDDQQIVNPVNDVNTVFNEIKANRVFGNIYAEINLLKGLRYRTVFGIDSAIPGRAGSTVLFLLHARALRPMPVIR